MELGISLYPDKTTYKEDQAYIDLAVEQGYTSVFMSFLQIDIKNPKKSIQRITESAMYASKCGMDVIMDVHPMVFRYLDKDEHDLSYFHEMGVTTLRLDSGYDGRTEARMTRNPYGIKIELNMSRNTHELERVMDFHPDITKLCASHNFYPQRFTALEISQFKECTKKFKQYQLPTAAFITSQAANVSPWPISEGLCTLEEHRDVPLLTQMKHLKMMNVLDRIIIGNAFATKEELISLKEEMDRTVDTLCVELYDTLPIEKTILFDSIQEYRGDASAYMIRSSKHRMKVSKESIPAHHTSDIKRGDVLILNETYGQYKGELQIALCDRPSDSRINVVGKICEDEQLLLDELQPFQMFQLKERK